MLGPLHKIRRTLITMRFAYKCGVLRRFSTNFMLVRMEEKNFGRGRRTAFFSKCTSPPNRAETKESRLRVSAPANLRFSIIFCEINAIAVWLFQMRFVQRIQFRLRVVWSHMISCENPRSCCEISPSIYNDMRTIDKIVEHSNQIKQCERLTENK